MAELLTNPKPEHNFLGILADFENTIRQALIKYRKHLQDIGVPLPIFIYIALIDVKNGSLVSPKTRSESSESFDQDDILVPAAVLDDPAKDIDSLIRPIMDLFWNAAGEERSPAFDADGRWVGY